MLTPLDIFEEPQFLGGVGGHLEYLLWGCAHEHKVPGPFALSIVRIFRHVNIVTIIGASLIPPNLKRK